MAKTLFDTNVFIVNITFLGGFKQEIVCWKTLYMVVYMMVVICYATSH